MIGGLISATGCDLCVVLCVVHGFNISAPCLLLRSSSAGSGQSYGDVK